MQHLAQVSVPSRDFERQVDVVDGAGIERRHTSPNKSPLHHPIRIKNDHGGGDMRSSFRRADCRSPYGTLDMHK